MSHTSFPHISEFDALFPRGPRPHAAAFPPSVCLNLVGSSSQATSRRLSSTTARPSSTPPPPPLPPSAETWLSRKCFRSCQTRTTWAHSTPRQVTQQVHTRTQAYTHTSLHAHASRTTLHTQVHTQVSHASLARCSHPSTRVSHTHKCLTQVSHKSLARLHTRLHTRIYTRLHTRLHTHVSRTQCPPHTCRTSPTCCVHAANLSSQTESQLFWFPPPRFLPIPQPTLPYLKPTLSQRRPS